MYKHLESENVTLLVNTETGELVEGVPVVVPAGSKIITPDQQKAQKEWSAKKEQKEIRRKIQDELGYFYFVMKEHEFGNISAENAARLIYLCTYLNYNNEFMLTRRTKMKKNNLKDILGLSTSTTFKFWKEVENIYIKDHGECGLKLCCSDIVRGKLVDINNQYQKVYMESVRNIYKAMPPTKHRYLGYIFKLLPYVNVEYNIICTNPKETDLKKVKPLKISEICNIIGYDTKNIKRFKEIYKQMIFEYHGQKERLFTFISKWDGEANMNAVVNPHILYSGNNYRKVEVFGAFAQIT